MPLSSKKKLATFFKHLPNGLSILRLLCGPVVFLTLLKNHYLSSASLFCFGVMTDFIDGKVARYFHITSKIGSILDPLADKVFVGLTAYGLCALEVIPFWFFLALVARDFILLLGGAICFLRPRQHPLPLPHTWGKFSLGFQALALFMGFLKLFHPGISEDILLGIFMIALITMIFSLGIYTTHFIWYSLHEK